MAIDWMAATTITSLVCSLLSCIGTSAALIYFGMSLSKGSIQIRTKLILNLLVAEWINSTNNSISGVWAMFSELTESTACTANGFIGQWSTQAADLCTLLIAIVTFMALRTTTKATFDGFMVKIDRHLNWILLGVWTFPLITASIGLGTVGYMPNGNWCWLKDAPRPLAVIMRYALLHAIRMFIYFLIVILYAILAIRLRKVAIEAEDEIESSEHSANSKDSLVTKSKSTYLRSAVVRLLAYPTAYVILSTPGCLVGAAMMALGLDTPGPMMDVIMYLNSYTQLIGFADASITVWNMMAMKKYSRGTGSKMSA